tara:strand:- start:88 stop:2193 length:2106 start_codon:yes stop_codon:yes gene_type:complete
MRTPILAFHFTATMNTFKSIGTLDQTLMQRCFVLATWSLVTTAVVLFADDDLTPKLRLQYRSDDQSLLYVVGDGASDAVAAQQICDSMNLRFNSIPSLETLPLDCSNHHAIIIGSNGVDFLGWHQDEARKEQVFSSLREFVANGGHLIVFGSYNGRNTEQFQEFGIHTTHFHNDHFERISGRSEVLFAGSESLVPSPPYVHSFGNVTVDEDRTAVVMLKRATASDPDDRRAEHNPEDPVFVTIAYQRGRVSYSPVEPHAGGPWLVPVVVKWILKGAPTNQSQLDETVVVPPSLVRERNFPPTPAFELSALRQSHKELLAELQRQSDDAETADQKIQLADVVLEQSENEAEAIKRYVQLRQACQYLAMGGAFKRAATLLAEISNQYQFDVHHAQLRLLKAAQESTVDIPGDELITASLRWADNASDVHQYEHATDYVAAAQSIAATDQRTDLEEQLSRRLAGLKPLTTAQQKVSSELGQAMDTLDADAKTRLGKFFALSCRDWQRGLPLLSEGSDMSLKACAQIDLATPESSAAQIEIARQWQDAGTTLTTLERQGTHDRSRQWYLAALPSLSGSEHEQIVADISKLDLPHVDLHFKLHLDGAGRLEVSSEGARWIDHFGNPVPTIELNQYLWQPEKTPVFQNRGVSSFLPTDTTLNYPKLRRIRGRGMVVLERNTAGIAIVNLNDVPVGSDDYEFVIEAAY